MVDKPLRGGESSAESRIDQMLDAGIAAYSAAAPRNGLQRRVMARVSSIEPPRAEGWFTSKWLSAHWFSTLRLASRWPAGSPQLGSPDAAQSRRAFNRQRRFALTCLVVLLCCVAALLTFNSVRRHSASTVARIERPPVESSPAHDLTAAGSQVPSEPVPQHQSASHRAARLREVAVSARNQRQQATSRRANSEPEIFPTPAPLTAEERALVALATQAPKELQRSLTAAAEQANKPITIAAIHIEALPPLIPPDLKTTPSKSAP